MRAILVAFVLIAYVMAVKAAPAEDLQILPNGHVRLNGGPELDLPGFHAALDRLAAQHPRPGLSLHPDRHASFKAVAAVMAEVQKHGFAIGFTGTESGQISSAMACSLLKTRVADFFNTVKAGPPADWRCSFLPLDPAYYIIRLNGVRSRNKGPGSGLMGYYAVRKSNGGVFGYDMAANRVVPIEKP